MLLSYVGVFMGVTPAVVGKTFLAWERSARNAIGDRSEFGSRQITEVRLSMSFYLSGCLSRVRGPTSRGPRTALHEASPPFRQSLLSIARGTARSDAPRMRRRPGTFRTRELSYRRLSAAGLRIAGCPVHLSGAPCAPVAKLRPDLSAPVQPRS